MNETFFNKKMVRLLVNQYTSRLEHYASHLREDATPDLCLVGERFLFELLSAVRVLSHDGKDESAVVGDLVFGILHASMADAYASARPEKVYIPPTPTMVN